MVTPVDRNRFYRHIKDIYSTGKELTARECSVELKRRGICQYGIRQESQPRLNEMVKMGMIEPCGSKLDETTRKIVTIYRKKVE